MPIIPLIIAVLVVGGAGTAVLADSAKPGDLLYPVDQIVERIQEKMPMSQSNRAMFWGELSDERAEELLALRNMNPNQFRNAVALKNWERHKEMAVERLAIHIEKVEAIQAKFQEKISATDNEAEITAFQRVIANLEAAKVRREARIEAVESRGFPGLDNVPIKSQIQGWQEKSPEIRAMIQAEVAKEFDSTIPAKEQQKEQQKTGSNK